MEVEGLHGEEGIGVCVGELESLWSVLGNRNSICVALRPDSPLTIGVAFYKWLSKWHLPAELP